MNSTPAPRPVRRELPTEIRPFASAPAAAGNTGRLFAAFMPAELSTVAIEQCVLRLQSRETAYRDAEVVSGLDLSRANELVAEARWRLKTIPATEDLARHREILDRALCGEPADEIIIGELVDRLISPRANARAANREPAIEMMVLVICAEQQVERFTPQVIVSALLHATKRCRFQPEVAEFLEILRERRAAVLRARERVSRLIDLRLNAAETLHVGDPSTVVAVDDSEAVIPF